MTWVRLYGKCRAYISLHVVQNDKTCHPACRTCVHRFCRLISVGTVGNCVPTLILQWERSYHASQLTNCNALIRCVATGGISVYIRYPTKSVTVLFTCGTLTRFKIAMTSSNVYPPPIKFLATPLALIEALSYVYNVKSRVCSQS